MLASLLLRPARAAFLVRPPRQPHASAAAKASHVAPRALLQPFGRPAADAAHRDDLALVGVAAEELERLEAVARALSSLALGCACEKLCSGAYTCKCGIQCALVGWDVLVVYEPCAKCQHAGSESLVGGEAVVASTLPVILWHSDAMEGGHCVVALRHCIALVGGEAKIVGS